MPFSAKLLLASITASMLSVSPSIAVAEENTIEDYRWAFETFEADVARKFESMQMVAQALMLLRDKSPTGRTKKLVIVAAPDAIKDGKLNFDSVDDASPIDFKSLTGLEVPIEDCLSVNVRLNETGTIFAIIDTTSVTDYQMEHCFFVFFAELMDGNSEDLLDSEMKEIFKSIAGM